MLEQKMMMMMMMMMDYPLFTGNGDCSEEKIRTLELKMMKKRKRRKGFLKERDEGGDKGENGYEKKALSFKAEE
ncbi:hypothetical protein L1987_81235 [Smallanthus sonchifolius]|uniref:Uncharacterized protein n=1 Tax=Smallanthus sonchifolius TaxID=185202 RepID=A0ACB8YQ34_9ASTR|nr:hypothetical protein L1987_81235 [Smallanthus sonchifolius]